MSRRPASAEGDSLVPTQFNKVLPDEARAAHVLPVMLAAAGDRSWRVRWSAASKYEAVCQALVARQQQQPQQQGEAEGAEGAQQGA